MVRVVSPPPNTQAGGPPLVDCPWLLIKRARSHLPYLEAVYYGGYFWKADGHSPCQQPFHLWNPKVHYRVHKIPPLDPIPSQPNPVSLIDPYFPKVDLNVILPSTPRSSQWSLTFGPSNQNPVNTSTLPMRATCRLFITVSWKLANSFKSYGGAYGKHVQPSDLFSERWVIGWGEGGPVEITWRVGDTHTVKYLLILWVSANVTNLCTGI
jgi:hypothetical protein